MRQPVNADRLGGGGDTSANYGGGCYYRFVRKFRQTKKIRIACKRSLFFTGAVFASHTTNQYPNPASTTTAKTGRNTR